MDLTMTCEDFGEDVNSKDHVLEASVFSSTKWVK